MKLRETLAQVRRRRFIRIDVEASHVVQAALDLFEPVRRYHRNTGDVIRSCLHRGEEDLYGSTRGRERQNCEGRLPSPPTTNASSALPGLSPPNKDLERSL